MKEDEMGGTCCTHGRDKKCVQYFGLKTWRKGPLRRRKCWWEDNIRIDFGEIWWEAASGSG